MRRASPLLSRGDDGSGILYPFWGSFKEVKTVFTPGLRPLGGTTVAAVHAYAVVLVVAVVGLAGTLVYHSVGLRAPIWVLGALIAVALLAERQSVKISANTEMSISVFPILFGAVLYGPLDAMLIGAFALALECRRPFVRWVIWTFSRSLVAGIAGLAAYSLLTDESSLGSLLVAAAAAAVAEVTGDIALNSLTVAIRGSGSFLETARAMSRLSVSIVPLYTPVLAVLVYAYRELSPWTLFLFFVPALAAQRLLVLYQEQRTLVDDLAAANQRLERAGLSFASALVAALDARDRYTAGHSAAVAVYARDIARRLGLPEEQQQLAHLCGLVHDIGKVGLPPGLLEKPGALTLDERRQMEEHSEIGERILTNVEDYQEIARIVRHHHERWDGNGYPDRVVGGEIPLLSRIIAVADAYNAMTSGRPYRDAMPSRVARLRLAQAADTQFDTTVVAAFEAILAGASESYLSGRHADFALEAQRQPALALASAGAA